MPKGYPDWSTTILTDMTWHTEGEKNNPANGQVLADTGPLPAGFYNVGLHLCGTTATVWMKLRLWDASTGSYSWTQFFILAAGDSMMLELPGPLFIDQNDRLSVIYYCAVAGYVQASIGAAKLAE